MKITLIRPSFGHRADGSYRSPARMEPLALAILAALTPREHQVVAVDERVEPVPFDAPTDLVGLSLCTFSALRGYEIAAAYRRRGVPVVAGGFHPTLAPDEAAQHVDAVVCGDAEETWPRLLADLAAGELQPRYSPPAPGPARTSVALPDRSVYRGKGYLPVQVVQFGRGCPHDCEFCAIRAFYGGRCAHRPVAEVVAELRATRPRRVFFADDNLLGQKEAFKELLAAIIPLKIRWSSQIDLGFADDPELVELARRSGCQSLTFGFESLDEANLRQMGKRVNRVTRYREQLARVRRAGIMVYGTFVFGYDEDDPGVFARTARFALEERMFIANFNPLLPLPGTRLHARLLAEGRLLHDRWWLDPTVSWHEALLRPRGMTPEQLAAGCRLAREQFNGLGGIVRRFCGSPAHTRNLDNALVFLAANLVSRLDIRAKTGLHLGSGRESPGGGTRCGSC
ncbi:MAG: radical SAM protein [Myxococcota bacterium]|nr:radical SAM protein [Myxococcota bacterium]